MKWVKQINLKTEEMFHVLFSNIKIHLCGIVSVDGVGDITAMWHHIVWVAGLTLFSLKCIVIFIFHHFFVTIVSHRWHEVGQTNQPENGGNVSCIILKYKDTSLRYCLSWWSRWYNCYVTPYRLGGWSYSVQFKMYSDIHFSSLFRYHCLA